MSKPILYFSQVVIASLRGFKLYSVINGKKGILTLGWENTLREGGSELRWVSHPLATISSLDYALLSTPKQIQVLRTGVANICEKKPEESLRELACGRLG